MKKNYSVPN